MKTVNFAHRPTPLAAFVAGAVVLSLLLSAALAAAYPTELNSGYSWVPIGPRPMTNQEPNFGGYVTGSPLANATGRITALAVDPQSNGQTIFVGAAGGGVSVTALLAGALLTRTRSARPNSSRWAHAGRAFVIFNDCYRNFGH